MKPRPAEIDRLLSTPSPAVRALLVYGPDEGLVQERVRTAMAAVVPDVSDPFRVAELSAASLNQDPARLRDEANALSLIGGDRVVRVRGAADAQAALFRDFLADGGGAALVVVESGDLAKSSTLRKLFEAANNAAAIACYADDPADVARLLESALRTAGLKIDPEARDLVISSLGADRGVTRSEIDKLVLFATGRATDTISIDDVIAMVPDASGFSLDDVSFAAADGDLPSLERALTRCWSDDESPVAVLRTLSRHFHRLQQVRLAVDGGSGVQQAIGALRPPVFFRRVQLLERQARLWSGRAVTTVLSRLLQEEMAVKRTGAPDTAIASKVALDIALLARRLKS